MKHLLFLTKQLYQYSGKILLINLFGMLLIGLLEGAGILMLIPMLSMTGLVEFQAGEGMLSTMFQRFDSLPEGLGLPVVLCAFIAVIFVQAVCQRSLMLRDIKIHTGFINHLRMQTYNALLNTTWDFFVKKRKSDLINSMTSELGRVTSGIQMFLNMLSSIVFTLIQIAVAFWLSPQLTLCILACGVALMLLSKKFINRSKQIGYEMTNIAKVYLAGMTDHFNGIKDIKSNMLEQSRREWLHSWNNRAARERIEFSKNVTMSQMYYKIASGALIALFIFISVSVFNARLEQLLLIIVIFSRLWPRLAGLQTNMEQLASCIPALQALLKLQEECNESAELRLRHQYAEIQPLSLNTGIECQGVYFRYQKSESKYALKDISLKITARSMTAIVGKSGAGKSTLIDMLMGLLKPERGELFVEGEPLTEQNLLRLRKSISYVPQDPFLFNGSIRDNLLMVKPDATESEMKEALDFSSAAEFVHQLPQGLDTCIGDRGIRLSGGERQRLVLARAILKKPTILILDEATSSLDTHNETKIQQAIDTIKGTMTIVVIAHRLSTIRNADQVIVLDEGEIIQTGAFGQLAKESKGMFKILLSHQEIGI